MIDTFRQEGGFAALAKYLKARISTPQFPSLELVHQILDALRDVIPSHVNSLDDQVAVKEMEKAPSSCVNQSWNISPASRMIR
jgi:hypothetical protein